MAEMETMGSPIPAEKAPSIINVLLAPLRPLSEKLKKYTHFIKDRSNNIKTCMLIGCIILGVTGVSFMALSVMPNLADVFYIDAPMRGLVSLIAGVSAGGLVLGDLNSKGAI